MDPFMGEIRMVAFKYAPEYWSDCNGALIPIEQNPALFSIISNRFGGDGNKTFALPNLTGRAPRGSGTGKDLSPAAWGDTEGAVETTLKVTEMPSHTHMVATYNGLTKDKPKFTDVPTSAFIARHLVENSTSVVESFVAKSTAFDTKLSGKAVDYVGSSEPHENMQPYLAIRYCIALMGVYPDKD
ncbi:phage tail protein [Ancylobacter sp.]|uniref:phage tail protein n=1 Tax=Ancylobacter sp. TaxID=1872567 RepID=UPI003BA861DF